MFCRKCGAEILENAKFCAKCGEIVEAHSKAPTETNVAPAVPLVQNAVPVAQPVAAKKTGMVLKVMGAVIVAIVIIAVAVFVNKPNEEIDYIATVKSHTPLAESQGLSYSYEQVLEKNILDAKWDEEVNDEGANVRISGSCAGIDADIIVTIEVKKDTQNPGTVTITPKSVEMDGEKLSDENEVAYFLLVLFQSYDEGCEDFSDILGDDLSSEPQGVGNQDGDSITINETFTYDDDYWGNMEVTLNYVEFTDEYIDEWGDTIYPDMDCIFIRADFTAKNLGTEPENFPAGIGTLIYDGTYEYDSRRTLGDISDIMSPLTAPVNGAVIFEVPVEVVESGKPISIYYDLVDGNFSFTIR